MLQEKIKEKATKKPKKFFKDKMSKFKIKEKAPKLNKTIKNKMWIKRGNERKRNKK